ncbi:MAG TPA: NUDIX hydrolase [Candidatus Saccharimonadia bacterium]|nr:NUDIX hydrolase [Candidatus Saccharimonadia bacterium]
MKVVVVTVVVRDGDRLLLVQQRKPQAFGLWGYPGGHVEPGETLEDALSREVHEEIGAQLTSSRPLRVDRRKNQLGNDFEHHAYFGTIEGNIVTRADELMGFGWFTLSDLDHMQDQLREVFVYEIAQMTLSN